MSYGFAIWVSFMLLLCWIPAHWKRRMVGAGLLTDIMVHVVLQTLFGGDAGGRVGMLFGGVLINVTLHAYRRFAGYEKLTMDGWQRYSPKGVLLNTNSPETA